MVANRKTQQKKAPINGGRQPEAKKRRYEVNEHGLIEETIDRRR